MSQKTFNHNMNNSDQNDSMKKIIKYFGDFISSGDAEDVLKIIDSLGAIGKGVELVITVRNWSISKKIKSFVETLNGKNIDGAQYEKICKKYGKEKILSEIIISLDRLRDEMHAKILANFVAALIAEQLEWDRFAQLTFCLELLNPQDIDQYIDRKYLGVSFITAGLAYLIFEPNTSPRAIGNGKLFNDFYEFGLKPYIDKQKRGSDET